MGNLLSRQNLMFAAVMATAVIVVMGYMKARKASAPAQTTPTPDTGA